MSPSLLLAVLSALLCGRVCCGQDCPIREGQNTRVAQIKILSVSARIIWPSVVQFHAGSVALLICTKNKPLMPSNVNMILCIKGFKLASFCCLPN